MVPDPRNGYSLGAIDFNRHFFLLLLFLDFLQAPSHLRPKLRTGTDVRLYKAAWRGIRVALFFPLQPPPLHHGTAKFGVLFPSSVLQAETGMHPLLCCLHDLAEDRTPRSVMQAKKKKKKRVSLVHKTLKFASPNLRSKEPGGQTDQEQKKNAIPF